MSSIASSFTVSLFTSSSLSASTAAAPVTSQSTDSLTELAQTLSCPLTEYIFKKPVQAPAPSGRTYEEAAIVKWIRAHSSNPQDPYSRQPLHEWDLTENRSMKDVIELQLRLFPQLKGQVYNEPDCTPPRVTQAPSPSALPSSSSASNVFSTTLSPSPSQESNVTDEPLFYFSGSHFTLSAHLYT